MSAIRSPSGREPALRRSNERCDSWHAPVQTSTLQPRSVTHQPSGAWLTSERAAIIDRTMSRPGAPRYTREQRDAIMRAVMVNGLSVAEARRRAVAGRLDVDAFAIPYPSACEIVRQDRDRYALEHPDVMRAELDRDILAMAAAARKHADKVRAQDNPNPDDIARAVKALAVARGAIALPVKQPAKQGTTSAPDAPHQQSGGVLERMGIGAANGTTHSTDEHAAPVALRASV